MNYLLIATIVLTLTACGTEEKADSRGNAGTDTTTTASTTTASNKASAASTPGNATIAAEPAAPEELWAYTFSGSYASSPDISEGTVDFYVTHFEILKFPSGNNMIFINCNRLQAGVVEETSYIMVAKAGVAKTSYFLAGQIDSWQLRIKYDGLNTIQAAHNVDANWANNVDFSYTAVKQ